MAGNVSKIQIEVEIDGKGGIKVLRQIGDESERIGNVGVKSFDKMGTSVGALDGRLSALDLAKFGLGIGAVTAALASGAVILMKATDAASSLNETVSKSNTIFRANAAEMRQWSSNSVAAMGMSQRAALENAATLGNMFKQLGAGTDLAAKNSRQMVQLSADLASFHNVAGGAEQVLEAMQASFRGEYDSLQRYIPTINAAAVQHEALAMTGKASAKELTNLEKALAAQRIIMRDAGDATGDFARTSDQHANAVRKLEGGLEDLMATAGRFTLGAVTAGISTLGNVVNNTNEGLKELEQTLQNYDGTGLTLWENIENSMAIMPGFFRMMVTSWADLFDQRREYETGLVGFLEFMRDQMTVQQRNLQATRGQVRAMSDEWSAINDEINAAGQTSVAANNAAGDATEANAAEVVALRTEWEKLNRIIDASRDIWGTGYDTDYGNDPVATAIQQHQLRLNNARLQTQQAIELQKAMAGAMPDSYGNYGPDVSELLIADAQAEEKLLADRARAYRDMYGDLKGQARDYYTVQAALLKKQRDDYAALTKNKALADLWYAAEEKKLLRERDLAGQDFFAGIKWGYQDLQDAQYTWAQAGLETFESAVRGMSSMFSNVFYDALKGDLDSLGDYFDAFADQMLRTFSNMLAQMATEQLMLTAMDALGGLFSFHTGAWEIKEDEQLAILQKGEMVLPRRLAAHVRDWLGMSPALTQAQLYTQVGAPSTVPSAINSMNGTGSTVSPALLNAQAQGGATGALATLGANIASLMSWLGPVGIAAGLVWTVGGIAQNFLESNSILGGGPPNVHPLMQAYAVSQGYMLGPGGQERFYYNSTEELMAAYEWWLQQIQGNVDRMQDIRSLGADAITGREAFESSLVPTGGGFRWGGWSDGPESGYYARMHGRELHLREDQVQAVRELNAGSGRSLVIQGPLVEVNTGTLVASDGDLDDLARTVEHKLGEIAEARL